MAVAVPGRVEQIAKLKKEIEAIRKTLEAPALGDAEIAALESATTTVPTDACSFFRNLMLKEPVPAEAEYTQLARAAALADSADTPALAELTVEQREIVSRLQNSLGDVEEGQGVGDDAETRKAYRSAHYPVLIQHGVPEADAGSRAWLCDRVLLSIGPNITDALKAQIYRCVGELTPGTAIDDAHIADLVGQVSKASKADEEIRQAQIKIVVENLGKQLKSETFARTVQRIFSDSEIIRLTAAVSSHLEGATIGRTVGPESIAAASEAASLGLRRQYFLYARHYAHRLQEQFGSKPALKKQLLTHAHKLLSTAWAARTELLSMENFEKQVLLAAQGSTPIISPTAREFPDLLAFGAETPKAFVGAGSPVAYQLGKLYLAEKRGAVIAQTEAGGRINFETRTQADAAVEAARALEARTEALPTSKTQAGYLKDGYLVVTKATLKSAETNSALKSAVVDAAAKALLFQGNIRYRSAPDGSLEVERGVVSLGNVDPELRSVMRDALVQVLHENPCVQIGSLPQDMFAEVSVQLREKMPAAEGMPAREFFTATCKAKHDPGSVPPSPRAFQAAHDADNTRKEAPTVAAP